MIKTKSDLLASTKLKRATVPVNALDGAEIELLELSLSARAELLRLVTEKSNAEVVRLVLRHGVPLLSDATDEELDAITPAAVEEITNLVYTVSGMLSEDDDEAKKP